MDIVDASEAIDRLISKRASQDRRPDPDEQEEMDRSHGQHILDVTDYSKERQEDPLLEAMNRAHQAKAGEE